MQRGEIGQQLATEVLSPDLNTVIIFVLVVLLLKLTLELTRGPWQKTMNSATPYQIHLIIKISATGFCRVLALGIF